MGCTSSKQVAGKAADANIALSRMRRRLSVGHGQTTIDPQSHTDPEEIDRGFFVKLSETQLLEIIPSRNSSISEAQRKWSLGSITDLEMNRKNSFGDKAVSMAGGADAEQQSKALGVGYACKKGMKPESPNQDSFFIVNVENDFTIYGVFDGHGSKGHDISNFVKEQLPKLIVTNPNFRTDTEKCLKDSFATVQKYLEVATKMELIDSGLSGTTGTVVVHWRNSNYIDIAYVGDSRAVLAYRTSGSNKRNALDLTTDHKPELPAEKKRIEENGGSVQFDGWANFRVYARGHGYPGLNMSRALGDLVGHFEAGISAEPEVCRIETCAEGRKSSLDTTSSEPCQPPPSSGATRCDEFLLICSDGVWEFISSEEAVEMVSLIVDKNPSKGSEAAEALAKESWQRWIKHENGMVVDDITALVIYLT